MAIFSKNLDMLNGTIWDKMVVFAIPLALTGVLQQRITLQTLRSSDILFLMRQWQPSARTFLSWA